MKQRLFALAAAVVMALGLDRLRRKRAPARAAPATPWRPTSLISQSTAHTLPATTRAVPLGQGNVLLVADITVKNTFEQSIEMYDTDFQVQWDDGDDAYAYPITTDMETYTEVEPVGENQLPGTYPMAVDEERSGELVYEVPSGFTDFSIAYLEQFVDDSGEESTGETFFVYFTAEDQTGASA